MIPSRFVLLEEFPLTPNGKIDYQSLRSLGFAWYTSEKIFALPQTTIQKLLVEVCSELLKIQNISIHDDFFDLGGDSLQAIRMSDRLQLLLKKKYSDTMDF